MKDSRWPVAKKDRLYLYTVVVRAGKDEHGVVLWKREQSNGTSIFEVMRNLGKKSDDVVYVSKEVIR
jgi:hypothetical protein